MDHIKCRVSLDDRQFNIKVDAQCTVSALQVKIRKHLNISDHEAIFLFFQYDGFFTSHECIHAGNRTLGDIKRENRMDVQIVRVCRENCFGAWSKMWVRAKIEPQAGVYMLTIVWSYYGLSHWEEISIHQTVEEARAHLLDIRCGGHLVEEKKE